MMKCGGCATVTVVVKDIGPRLRKSSHGKDRVRRSVITTHIRKPLGIISHLPFPSDLVEIRMLHEKQCIVAAIDRIFHESAGCSMACTVWVTIVALPEY
jgi:hypothetical protein